MTLKTLARAITGICPPWFAGSRTTARNAGFSCSTRTMKRAGVKISIAFFDDVLPMQSIQDDTITFCGPKNSHGHRQFPTADCIGVIRDGKSVAVGKAKPMAVSDTR